MSRGRSSTSASTERANTAKPPTNPNQPPQQPELRLACESGHDAESDADSFEDSASICTTSTRDASTDQSMAISSLWGLLAEVAGYWQSVSSHSSNPLNSTKRTLVDCILFTKGPYQDAWQSSSAELICALSRAAAIPFTDQYLALSTASMPAYDRPIRDNS